VDSSNLKQTTKRNILLVDDDRAFAESMADVLRLDGHAVDTVSTSDEAIKRFAVNAYDLTFLDLQLPGVSGLATILSLRRIDAEAAIYLITGHTVEYLLDTEIGHGRWHSLRNPLDEEYLLSAVEKIKPAGVLLAAGEPSLAHRLRVILEGHGTTAEIARNRKEAFECTPGGNGVLILNLRSTILEGLEIYAELRQRRQHLPTIFCSAQDFGEIDPNDVEKMLEVTGVLSKPFSPKVLHKALESLVEKYPAAVHPPAISGDA
jgi:DNA-binding response OmpR family regulator